MSFIKCELCNVEIKGDKCIFAVCRRVIDGEEYIFCCPRCADEFERKRAKKKLENRT